MNKASKQQAAEQLVRAVLTQDLHQEVSAAVVRDVAAKVARAIPDLPPQKQQQS